MQGVDDHGNGWIDSLGKKGVWTSKNKEFSGIDRTQRQRWAINTVTMKIILYWYLNQIINGTDHEENTESQGEKKDFLC